jgi:hypothetical protein
MIHYECGSAADGPKCRLAQIRLLGLLGAQDIKLHSV